MRRAFCIVGLVCVAGAVAANAQVPAQGKQHSTVVLRSSPPDAADACPAEFAASRVAGQGQIASAGEGQPAGRGISIYVSFPAKAADPVLEARVTLLGPAGLHIASTALAAGPGELAHETVTLELRPDSAGRYGAVARAQRLTGVSAIQLDHLVYADGGVWQHGNPGRSCNLALQSEMLVGENR